MSALGPVVNAILNRHKPQRETQPAPPKKLKSKQKMNLRALEDEKSAPAALLSGGKLEVAGVKAAVVVAVVTMQERYEIHASG